MNIKELAVEKLVPYINNSRTHSEEQIAQVAASIKEFGFLNPIITDGEQGIIAGHCRVLAAKYLGIDKVPCIEATYLSEAQKKAFIIADNKLALNAGWDEQLLKIELESLGELDFDLSLTGFNNQELADLTLTEVDFEDDSNDKAERSGSLARDFVIPPFSVLNAREGTWVDRKQVWLDLGIASEVGRGDQLAFSSSSLPAEFYDLKNEYEKKIGHKVKWAEFREAHPDLNYLTGTSIFDPVLCELAYLWFSKEGSVVVDPFSGGSVRGIVAAKCGRQYYGNDLRDEQIQANREQWQQLACDEVAPIWHCGDSTEIDTFFSDIKADFIFSCPPYADLEVYSDNPNDLSTMAYDEFLAAYREIIYKTCSLLNDNRFACFVVGEVRDKKGLYRNFVADTIKCFMEAGLSYYNEAILVTSVGSLPMRARKPFSVSRKMGKTHQNILVFVKGDPQLATAYCGTVDVSWGVDNESEVS